MAAMKISNFVQLRADGKLIPNGMTVKSMLSLGWEPSKVVALRWTYGSHQVEFAPGPPVHAIVVPGEDFVAALVYAGGEGAASRLTIINPDGSIHGALENRLDVAGSTAAGEFGWFDPAMTPAANVFGTVFQTSSGDDLRCDIDASSRSVLRVARSR